jgi:Flp pilus assembly protein TadD
MILNNYGAYLLNVVHDGQGAMGATLSAAVQDPKNPYFQINLAKLALALGNSAEATAHLKLAESLDKTNSYSAAIQALTLQME